MTEEEYLREQIAAIQREYQKVIKPYLDRLVRIAQMKTGPQIVISAQQYNELKSKGFL